MSRKIGMIFKEEMVRAILAGRKWQTRRPLLAPTTPRANPGDKLWVREKWADLRGMGFDGLTAYGADTLPGTDSDEIRKEFGVKWKPSIHLPRARARIFLPLVNVWEERLQHITEEGVVAEGLRCLSKDGGLTYKWGLPDKDGYPGTDNDGCPWSHWDKDPLRAFTIQVWNRIYRDNCSWGYNPPVRVYEWDPRNIVVL